MLTRNVVAKSRLKCEVWDRFGDGGVHDISPIICGWRYWAKPDILTSNIGLKRQHSTFNIMFNIGLFLYKNIRYLCKSMSVHDRVRLMSLFMFISEETSILLSYLV
jgi:hypothetical protein